MQKVYLLRLIDDKSCVLKFIWQSYLYYLIDVTPQIDRLPVVCELVVA